MESLPVFFTQGACYNLGIEGLAVMAPDLDDKPAVEEGRSVCLSCDVESMCLGWALKHRRGDQALYGAHTGPERTNIARKITRNRGKRQS